MITMCVSALRRQIEKLARLRWRFGGPDRIGGDSLVLAGPLGLKHYRDRSQDIAVIVDERDSWHGCALGSVPN